MRIDQAEFAGTFAARPQNLAWFLGAGASRTSGLPTAIDVLWDLKRRYYCQEENQEIVLQDVQVAAVADRIQSFMDSRGFPALWSDGEYSAYFERIFGEDRERQRKYLRAILDEDKVTLAIGSRVLAAMLVLGSARVVFTTNFDSVVEKAYAEVGGGSLAAYHLEGAHSAIAALNNEEYPLYCKLHGDFRYDSLMNLSEDLKSQNDELSACFRAASSRFGMVVAGYSGRDESVMSMFEQVLESENPFPHGLYWTGIDSGRLHPAVERLLDRATSAGVDAHYVQVETFDAFMLRLWRNLDGKTRALDEAVRRSRLTTVGIPLPRPGRANPLVRLNALAVGAWPETCFEIELSKNLDWSSLRELSRCHRDLILTKADKVLCWGDRGEIESAFGSSLLNVTERQLGASDAVTPQLKGFFEEALCRALVRGMPLLQRSRHMAGHLIVDGKDKDASELEPLRSALGQTSGRVSGIERKPEEVRGGRTGVDWAESLRVTLEVKCGQLWVLLEPDIWIWPPSSRDDAVEFLDRKRGDRFNKKFTEILDAWIRVVLRTEERGTEVELSSFAGGEGPANPRFLVGTRTAFTRRGTS